MSPAPDVRAACPFRSPAVYLAPKCAGVRLLSKCLNNDMIRSVITSVLSTTIVVMLAACGGEEDPPDNQIFHLSEVRAENLRLVGMAKRMGGDTAGSRSDARVPSPEGSKVAYCQGKAVYVADADGKTSKLVYDASSESDVRACYNLRWSPDGEELSFTLGKQEAGDSLKLMTVVITLGKSSDNE